MNKYIFFTFAPRKNKTLRIMKQITILQLNEQNKETRHKMFASLSLLHRLGLSVNIKEYNNVWSGEMDVEDAEDVFIQLQGQKPEGYKGHSLSVSDIVIIDGRTLYCDRYGFVDITESEANRKAA